MTTLACDYESRVTRSTRAGYTTNTFSYNGVGTRVGKVDSVGTATFMRDGVSVTAPVVNDGAANYTPGISERRSSATTFFHSGIKNTDVQTNVSETVSASRMYDAFGNVISSTGAFKSPFGYAGRFGYQEDADHGLRLLGHRYYDSDTGRFLTRDPIKDDRNWYAYGAGAHDPLTGVDPTGLMLMAALTALATDEYSGSIPFGARGGSPSDAGINRDDKPAQNWAEFMRDTLVESPSPIPGKGIGDAFSGIPFKDIDAKRQIYKEIADDLYDDDNNNTGLTWYQDPEHHRRPYRFGQ